MQINDGYTRRSNLEQEEEEKEDKEQPFLVLYQQDPRCCPFEPLTTKGRVKEQLSRINTFFIYLEFLLYDH